MNERVLSGLLLLALFHSVLAHSSAPESTESPAAAGSANQIPIELRENFALLVAKVDGIDVPLQFDLGNSAALTLHQSVLDLIKAVPTGESTKLQDPRGVFEAPLYKVARLQIGTALFTDVIAQLDVHSPDYQPTQIGQKGFLGTGLFKSYELVLDYSHRTMTLIPPASDGGSPGACKGTAVPFLAKWRGEPVTEAETDLGRATLWWDTGAPMSLLRKTFAQEMRSQPDEETVTTKRFTLGGTDFGPWKFMIWDVTLPGFDGLIGYDFFASHVVCIDFPGNRLVIGQ